MVDNHKGFQVFVNVIMILLAAICLLPFILLFISSITNESALISNGYSFFPKELSFDAYTYLFTSSSKIIKGYGVTRFVTTVGTTIGILLTILLAYPLSRKELPGRNIIAFIIFFTMLFNGGLVPSYMMWSNLFQIKNTIWALIIPTLLMNPFYIIMMRTYFVTNIPEEVIEAARIDGASEFRILVDIVMHLSVPMVATLGLLVGLGYWNDWQNGLYYITNKTDLFSIQNSLNRMLQDVQFLTSGSAGSNVADLAKNIPSIGIKMAIAVIAILPIMVIYPFFQKYFVKGITVGAVKG